MADARLKTPALWLPLPPDTVKTQPVLRTGIRALKAARVTDPFATLGARAGR
jgi:hypothetical protein